jgi:excisionase family DNA binding protein
MSEAAETVVTIPKRGFSVSDAVIYTGRPRSALYEDIASGALNSYKVGRRRLILREDLDDYLDRITHQRMSQVPDDHAGPNR